MKNNFLKLSKKLLTNNIQKNKELTIPTSPLHKKNIKNTLEAEIQYEKEEYKNVDKNSYEDFLLKSKFKFTEKNPYSTKLTLTKTQGPYIISVLCISNPPFPQNNPEDFNGKVN